MVSMNECCSSSHGMYSDAECHGYYKDSFGETVDRVSTTKVPDEPLFEYDAKNDMLHFPSEDHLFAYLGVGSIRKRSNASGEHDFHGWISASPKPILSTVYSPWRTETASFDSPETKPCTVSSASKLTSPTISTPVYLKE